MVSDKQEWPQTGFVGRVWFVIVTLIYAAIFGPSTLMVVSLVQGEINGQSPSMTFAAIYLAVMAVFVCDVQCFRVSKSIRRVKENAKHPYKVSFLSWETNGMLLALSPLLIVIAMFVTAVSMFKN